jgi:hypothetical protein
MPEVLLERRRRLNPEAPEEVVTFSPQSSRNWTMTRCRMVPTFDSDRFSRRPISALESSAPYLSATSSWERSGSRARIAMSRSRRSFASTTASGVVPAALVAAASIGRCDRRVRK